MKKHTHTQTPTLPDGLLIHKKGTMTYAEILSKVKSIPGVEQLGKTVTKIRRMANGDLLLVLEKSAANLVSFRSSVKETLGEEVDVKTRTHEIDLVIKDLDELTTKEDICAALAQ